MTEEIEALYQQVGKNIVSLVDMEFSDLWLYAAVEEGWIRYKTLFKSTGGKFYELMVDPDTDLLLDLWDASRKRGDNWDEMTFHVSSEGNFEVSFEYGVPEDLLHDFDRPKQWVSKNLGNVEIITHLPPSLSDN